jgi:hypothetical protein
MQIEGLKRLRVLLNICVVLARGMSSNFWIRFLAFSIAARLFSEDLFLFSGERSEETLTNVMDGLLMFISGSLLELIVSICLGLKV